MGKKTSLYACHVQQHAKMVDFAGWEMPLHYGSQLKEHSAVRSAAGVFDVSHMTVVDFSGPEVAAYLRYLLANNIDRLIPGKALYTCMLNETGGIIDDLIVYKITDEYYRLVVNSGTREKDLAWFEKIAAVFQVHFEEKTDLAMLAIQGPKVMAQLNAIFPSFDVKALMQLKPFHFLRMEDWFIARTGYTGEDGFEIILPNEKAPLFWEDLMKLGITPCGLGARDTLRLEAGLNLYGSDMDETVTPFESNLAWTVALEPATRAFIGRDALEKQLQAGISRKLVGLVLESQGVLRNHQKVIVEGIGQGEITSGSYSPTLAQGIALARVPFATENQCQIEMRGKLLPAKVIKPPFLQKGKKTSSETKKNGAVI